MQTLQREEASALLEKRRRTAGLHNFQMLPREIFDVLLCHICLIDFLNMPAVCNAMHFRMTNDEEKWLKAVAARMALRRQFFRGHDKSLQEHDARVDRFFHTPRGWQLPPIVKESRGNPARDVMRCKRRVKLHLMLKRHGGAALYTRLCTEVCAAIRNWRAAKSTLYSQMWEMSTLQLSDTDDLDKAVGRVKAAVQALRDFFTTNNVYPILSCYSEVSTSVDRFDASIALLWLRELESTSFKLPGCA